MDFDETNLGLNFSSNISKLLQATPSLNPSILFYKLAY